MTLLRAGLAPRWGFPLRCGLAASGWVAVAATAGLPAGGVVRVVITAVFLLVCPGLAAARWARPAAQREIGWTAVLETVVLAVVLSSSLAVLAVVPFYLNGAFTTLRVLLALAVVTSSLALLPLPGRGRPPAPRVDPDPAPVAPPADPPQPPPPEPETTPDPGASRNAEPAPRDTLAADRRVWQVPGLLRFVAGTGLAVGVGIAIVVRRRG